MWRLPLVYGVSFLAILAVLWLLCELVWRWLQDTGTADDYVSARWIKDSHTER